MQETVDIVSTFISNVGFPIAACGFMGYMYYKQVAESRVLLASIQESLDKLISLLEWQSKGDSKE